MKKKPNILWWLVLVFTSGVLISEYTLGNNHSNYHLENHKYHALK